MSAAITAEILRKIAPRMGAKRAVRQEQILADIAKRTLMMERIAALDTPLRLAHFLAQTAHESDGFCTTEEYASGAAYEGRKSLGNSQAGDGRRFKGRGLIQVTGRKNYAAFGEWLKNKAGSYMRSTYEPNEVADFPYALLSALWYWQSRKLNIWADRDDLATLTNLINCGRVSCRANGAISRRQYLERAKAALGTGEVRPSGVLRRGAKGEAVRATQKALAAKGYYDGQIDGVFGGAMEASVHRFQADNKLKADGIIGSATAALLFVPDITLADIQKSLGGGDEQA